MTQEEKSSIHDHILQSDYPETFELLKSIGNTNGFSKVKSLFKDKKKLV